MIRIPTIPGHYFLYEYSKLACVYTLKEKLYISEGAGGISRVPEKQRDKTLHIVMEGDRWPRVLDGFLSEYKKRDILFFHVNAKFQYTREEALSLRMD